MSNRDSHFDPRVVDAFRRIDDGVLRQLAADAHIAADAQIAADTE